MTRDRVAQLEEDITRTPAEAGTTEMKEETADSKEEEEQIGAEEVETEETIEDKKVVGASREAAQRSEYLTMP
jgi:hypothetical protein